MVYKGPREVYYPIQNFSNYYYFFKFNINGPRLVVDGFKSYHKHLKYYIQILKGWKLVSSSKGNVVLKTPKNQNKWFTTSSLVSKPDNLILSIKKIYQCF